MDEANCKLSQTNAKTGWFWALLVGRVFRGLAPPNTGEEIDAIFSLHVLKYLCMTTYRRETM